MSDTRTYCLIYRCRMCGTRYAEGGRTSAIDKMMPNIALDLEAMVPLIIPHPCEDGRKRGLADLIGAEVEE